jgi:hypothetical protein
VSAPLLVGGPCGECARCVPRFEPCDGNDRAVWARGTVVYQISSAK